MSTRKERYIELPQVSAGSLRLLKVVTYGSPDAEPKVYLQASLHADELPGMMVLYKLQQLLNDIDSRGDIAGYIVIVPVANPIGLAQRMQGNILGRLDFETGRNFNRGWGTGGDVDLVEDAITRLDKANDTFGNDAIHNRQLIAEALRQAVRSLPAFDEAATLKRTLLELAIDADICLDLHCDNEAVMHMYTHSDSWPRARELAVWMDCEAVFLAEESGGHPFDESVSRPWFEIAKHYAEVALPDAPLSVTLELRGLGDVDELLAATDAEHLVEFLKGEGVINGATATLPKVRCDATPLAGVEHIRATEAGLVSHCVAVGDQIKTGDTVARIIDPMASFGDGVTELRAGTDGLVYARTHHRIIAPGDVVTGIAGSTPLAGKGSGLLTD
ncbi:MAG: succinylglutamate desuccinylase [marine bacterium B5-7]|nr:MAG: succinylglutamate desuccinylase [marine bacterium B5-7]